ncbi:MAG: hypothetical protein JWP63_5781, partial [Candidatus Solibacter sp.]|nr:hypothetical protein [Candidatus Solibacter sp.]
MTPSPKLPPPTDFPGVLAAEIKDIRARRAVLFPHQLPLSGGVQGDPHAYAEAHRTRALGLAFSGGGIRSATFNLGILQGLAELGLLPFIDYLSTVSGGGYIGAWLHSIIRNKFKGDPVVAQGELHPRRVPGVPESDPISFLRKYSNYLAPQPGLFSPDFWTIGSVWIRNMSLNLAILLPFLMAVVLTVLASGVLQQTYGPGLKFEIGRDIWALALLAAVIVVAANLRQIVFTQFPNLKPRMHVPDLSGRFVVGGATVCIIFASYILGAFNFEPHPFLSGLLLVGLFSALQWMGGFRLCYRARHNGANGWFYLISIPIICAAFTAVLLLAVWNVTGRWVHPDVEWLRIAFGPPLILVVWMCGTTLQIGLMGSDFPDAAREWLARLGASVSIGMAGYIGLFVLAVFGPYWLAWVTLTWAPAGIALVGGWLGSAVAGYLTGKSAKTTGQPNEQADTPTRAMELIGVVSPIAFLAGFLLFVS